MTCKYDGAERPRILPGRHEDDCAGNECRGCQPCPWVHCRRCYREHVEAETGTCPNCLADVRTDIAEITRMVAALPAEVRVKGIDSEAMNLLGPTADPEALGHMRASINVGRIPADWLEVADDERHPLLVLGSWMEAYIEAFNHVDPERITVASAASYLNRNLTYIGAEADVPFEDFARDVAGCRSHMERVLHDGEQVETGAPCMTCEKPLLRVYENGALPWFHKDDSRPIADRDGWACRRCREFRSEKDYRLNVADLHRSSAEWLSAPDMIERTGISRGSLTGWASLGKVKRRTSGGRVVYRVADVEARLTDGDDAA